MELVRRSKLLSFGKSWKSRDLVVSTLAYCPIEETADLMVKSFDFFTPKETGFLGLPKSETVESFLNEDYDILIDLSITEQIAVQYIVALSKAPMKVGWSSSQHNYYDLMIDISKQPECGVFNETNQIVS